MDEALIRLLSEAGLPALGLRGRRRLCEEGRVWLQGRPCAPGVRLRPGQEVRFVAPPFPDQPAGQEACNLMTATGCGTAADAACGAKFATSHAFPVSEPAPRLLTSACGLAVLNKTAGLHSVALAGRAVPSLEACLPVLLAGLPTAEGFPRLLNRLDQETSGLVAAALDQDGGARWRKAEAEGRIIKRYLALTRGIPSEGCRNARLDTARRRRTRVLPEPDPDPRRVTLVTPLWALPQGNGLVIGLAGCQIHHGARHQIRAHLAAGGPGFQMPELATAQAVTPPPAGPGNAPYRAAGTPLLGDPLYGGEAPEASGGLPRPDWLPARPRFFLHHAKLVLPGLATQVLPDWFGLLPPAAQEAALAWLERAGD